MTETARRKRRKGPRATGRRQGVTPPKIQGQRKVILAQYPTSARSSVAPRFRIAPWCPRISSSLRLFLQGARPTHERSETGLCAARAPPRRRVGSRARETRFCNIGPGPRDAVWHTHGLAPAIGDWRMFRKTAVSGPSPCGGPSGRRAGENEVQAALCGFPRSGRMRWAAAACELADVSPSA